MSGMRARISQMITPPHMAAVTACLAIAAGSATLLGWFTGVDALVRLSPGFAPMKPNTAVCFILCGLSLLLRLAPAGRLLADETGKRDALPLALRSAATACALLAGGIGLVTLGEHLLSWNTGLDHLLFTDAVRADGHAPPGRMTHVAAANFALLGLSLSFLDFEPRRGFLPAQHAALLVSLTGLIAVLGYLYGVSSLYGVFPYSSMALHTALCFTVLGLGVMMARPQKGLMSVVTSPHGGGMTARRLLPAAILLPAALGWVRLQGELQGFYDGKFGLALFASSNIITFVTLVWFSARRLNSLDAKRRQAHDGLVLGARELRHANERLRDEVLEHRLTEEARRRAERQLHQLQKMESLGTLAGGIAHDFNNILTAVYLNADRARKQVSPEHPTARNLDEIARAGVRAAELVRRIMTFGRQDEPVLKAVNLRQSVEESLQLLRLSLPPRVALETVLEDDLPRVAADSTQIHQILLNLGTNAIHAMEPRGGVLGIRLRRFHVTPGLTRELTGLREGPHVRLTVSDTGTGMEKAVLDRIFDPFFTTKEPGIGTGLGLSVVHSIVNLHDGCITAYSEPQRGTVFHVYFPVTAAGDDVADPLPADIPRGKGERILCVDDDPVVLSACAEMMEDLGYKVTAFDDPRIAREEFRARPHEFDLLVTDLSMPGMSGLDLIREMRLIAPGLPAVLSSGYLSSEEAVGAREAEVTAFVQKPNVVEELGNALAKAFAPKRKGGPSAETGPRRP